MDIDSTKISLSHNVWSSLESTVADVRKGIVKIRMITGTYIPDSMTMLGQRSFSVVDSVGPTLETDVGSGSTRPGTNSAPESTRPRVNSAGSTLISLW